MNVLPFRNFLIYW